MVARTDRSASSHDWELESSSLSSLNVALVYDKDTHSCGHKLALDRLVHRIREAVHGAASCPVCGLAMTLVKDEAAQDPSSQTVTFKYGKLTYELTIPDASAASHAPTSWWSPLASQTKTTRHTVQSRITQVLGLNLADMKILFKGRMLYPSSSSGSNEQEISDTLLSHRNPLHGKSQLLVMGTVEAFQLPKHAPTSQQGGGGLWNRLVGFSQRLVVSTLNFSVSILLNILQGIYNFAMPLLKRNGEPSSADAARRRD